MRQFCTTFLSLTLIALLIGCAGTTAIAKGNTRISTTTVVAPLSEPPVSSAPSASRLETTEENNRIAVTLRVGEKDFSATLNDSEAAQAFIKYFPMTVKMEDLNRQEKFYALPDNLPADSIERPATIYNGDIFCWSGNTLVLFYSTFQNSYGGYVRLGVVNDPAGLAAALGSGSTEVTWTLAQPKDLATVK